MYICMNGRRNRLHHDTGIYGPFDKFVPVLKKDGQYVLLAEDEYNRLKVVGTKCRGNASWLNEPLDGRGGIAGRFPYLTYPFRLTRIESNPIGHACRGRARSWGEIS